MSKTVDIDIGAVDEPESTGPPQYYDASFYHLMTACTHCPIRRDARQVVPGFGPSDAEFLFLGQNPGEEEDEDGRPFVGRTGRELDKWLDALQIARERVVLSNVVKCHTHQNREPRAREVEVCRDKWLPEELAYLTKVSIIVTLGNPATRAVLGKTAQSPAALQLYWATATHGGRTFTVYPLPHPAFVIRAASSKERLYNPSDGLLAQLRSVWVRQHAEVYERARRSQ